MPSGKDGSKPKKGTKHTMPTKDNEVGLNSREGSARIESIEDLLRSRGFFDTAERDKKDTEVLVS